MATKTVNATPEQDPPVGDDASELEALRAENDKLRAERDDLREALETEGSATPARFTTDADPTERRKQQALDERATMARSEGARQDRIQQENAARAEGRPIAGGLREPHSDIRFDDTPASATRHRHADDGE